MTRRASHSPSDSPPRSASGWQRRGSVLLAVAFLCALLSSWAHEVEVLPGPVGHTCQADAHLADGPHLHADVDCALCDLTHGWGSTSDPPPVAGDLRPLTPAPRRPRSVRPDHGALFSFLSRGPPAA